MTAQERLQRWNPYRTSGGRRGLRYVFFAEESAQAQEIPHESWRVSSSLSEGACKLADTISVGSLAPQS